VPATLGDVRRIRLNDGARTMADLSAGVNPVRPDF
jgi:hypothetical protein